MISFFLSSAPLRLLLTLPHTSMLSFSFRPHLLSLCCLLFRLPQLSWRKKGLDFREIAEKFCNLQQSHRHTNTRRKKEHRMAQVKSRLSCLNVPWCYCLSNRLLANKLSSMGDLRFQSSSHSACLCCFLCESLWSATVCDAKVLFEKSFPFSFPFESAVIDRTHLNVKSFL